MANQKYTLANKHQSEATIATLNKHIADLKLINDAEHNNIVSLMPGIHPPHKLTKTEWDEAFTKEGWCSSNKLSDRYTDTNGIKSVAYEQYSAMYTINADAKIATALMPSKIKQLEDDSNSFDSGIDNVMSDKYLTFTEALLILCGLNPISLQNTIKQGFSPNDEIIEYLASETDDARMLKKCNDFQDEKILTLDFITWAINSNLLIKRTPSQADKAKQIIEKNIVSFLEDKLRPYNLKALANTPSITKELPSPPGERSSRYGEKQITSFIKAIYPNLSKNTQDKITWSP